MCPAVANTTTPEPTNPPIHTTPASTFPTAEAEAEAAYTAITTFAAHHHHTLRTPILIAPHPTAPQILTHESTLALPPRLLHSAFLHAQSIFFPNQPNNPLDATFLLLLCSPEHHTAANARKRHVLAHPELLLQELAVVESLLTSPLHKHTKSPTLWQHRRWLLQRFQHHPPLRAEMAVVFKAAEEHRSNYYAWDYARWVVRWCRGVGGAAEGEVVEQVQKWAGMHVSDCSAWAFWGWLLRGLSAAERGIRVRRVMEESCGVVGGHEAVWAAVRGVMGRAEVGMLRGLVAEAEGREGREEELQRRALEWCERWGCWDDDEEVRGEAGTGDARR